MNSSLFRNIRFYILIFSLTLSIGIYFYIQQTVGEGTEQIIKLTQTYALTAVTYLYLAVFATPLTSTFTFLPFRGLYLKARRAIGVSAFYFGVLHASFAFFGELGGFAGLPFLNFNYLLAISLSFIGLVILALMASTSFDYWVEKLTFPKWKLLHRFVYLAAILITIHALMLGSHFTNLAGIIPQIFAGALAILLLLEANRFDRFLSQKLYPPVEGQTATYPRFGLVTIIVAVIVGIYLFSPLTAGGTVAPLGIHSQHIQIAQQNQTGTIAQPSNLPLNPALQGDRRIRFTARFDHPDNVQVGAPTELNFSINFASNGAPEYLYSFVYSKTMHLIIVDDSLNYFNHLHPSQEKNNFKVTTQFPNPGRYHLYISFQPAGAIEQQFAFQLNVAGSGSAQTGAKPDYNHDKVFDGTKVKVEPDTLSATQLNNFNQKMKFTLTDATTNQPLTNLKPYLAAFGHLTMIDTQTYEYIHVHPTNLVPPKDTDTSGPTVEFMPLGLYTPIPPGIYKIFAEFNPNGKLLTSDFFIKIEQ